MKGLQIDTYPLSTEDKYCRRLISSSLIAQHASHLCAPTCLNKREGLWLFRLHKNWVKVIIRG